MRIAYTPPIFYHQKFGGISRYFVELAKREAAKGNQPGIFAPKDSNHYLKESQLPVIEASYFGSIYGKLPNRLKFGRHPYELLPIRFEIQARIRSWKPDVVHETYYYDKKLGPLKTPTVLTVYDMIHEIFPQAFPASDPTSKVKKKAVANADKIICISHSTARDLQRILDVPAAKISVIHLGWDTFINFEYSSMRPHDVLRKPYFLFVGARTGYKNFCGLLRGFAACTRLRTDFDIVAFGGGVFENKEVEIIRHLGLNGAVHHLSGNDQILGKLYTGAHAFVYPSLYEGFGLPPLEAMAHDCPVIASNTSSMPEVVGNAGRLFDPQIIEEITEALSDVAYSDITRKDMITKGRSRLHTFSWSECASKTEQVYHSLL
jgi:glycosyltransferase involved in cell wall biosynthesis